MHTLGAGLVSGEDFRILAGDFCGLRDGAAQADGLRQLAILARIGAAVVLAQPIHTQRRQCRQCHP